MEAKEKHVLWCEVVWKPDCVNSQLELDGVWKPRLPHGVKSLKLFYQNLAKDIPIYMEFMPSTEVLRKLISRATQIEPKKIDTVLNPYNKKTQLNFIFKNHKPPVEHELAVLCIVQKNFKYQ